MHAGNVSAVTNEVYALFSIIHYATYSDYANFILYLEAYEFQEISKINSNVIWIIYKTINYSNVPTQQKHEGESFMLTLYSSFPFIKLF